MMKTCTKCNTEKSFSEFHRKKKGSDGLMSICKSCRRAYMRERRARPGMKERLNAYNAERREISRSLIKKYLREHPCVDCGEQDWIVLEFDHVRGVKSQNISVMVANGIVWKKILAEIDKCDVVCANCHRRRTYERDDTYRTD